MTRHILTACDYDFRAFGAAGAKTFDPGDQTQIDLQVMEAQDTRKMRDDSKVHHIIEDSMFVPRKRVSHIIEDALMFVPRKRGKSYHRGLISPRTMFVPHKPGRSYHRDS